MKDTPFRDSDALTCMMYSRGRERCVSRRFSPTSQPRFERHAHRGFFNEMTPAAAPTAPGNGRPLRRIDMPDLTTGTPSYDAIHSRLTHRRGRARRQACVDCGQSARHWSYDHTDPNELTDARGREYSVDLTHYVPRCRACHIVFDQAYRRAGIPRLHALATELAPQIRAAAHERERARTFGDFAKMLRWDEELDRLTAQLETPRAERPAARL